MRFNLCNYLGHFWKNVIYARDNLHDYGFSCVYSDSLALPIWLNFILCWKSHNAMHHILYIKYALRFSSSYWFIKMANFQEIVIYQFASIFSFCCILFTFIFPPLQSIFPINCVISSIYTKIIFSVSKDSNRIHLLLKTQ